MMSKNGLRLLIVIILMAAAAFILLPSSVLGAALLIVGLGVLVVMLLALPGTPRDEPPAADAAPLCPQCGHQMIFVQWQPDAAEYRCREHGRYALDSQGLFS